MYSMYLQYAQRDRGLRCHCHTIGAGLSLLRISRNSRLPILLQAISARSALCFSLRSQTKPIYGESCDLKLVLCHVIPRNNWVNAFRACLGLGLRLGRLLSELI